MVPEPVGVGACALHLDPGDAPRCPRLRKDRADHRRPRRGRSRPGWTSSASRTVTPEPEVREEGGELAADGPAADHGHRGRELVEVQELVGGEDQAAVDLEAGQGPGHRPGGQHDVAPDDLGAGVLAVDHPDPAAGQQRPGPRQHRDLAALEQPREAPEELVDDLALARPG